jgi:hypothetical protein
MQNIQRLSISDEYVDILRSEKTAYIAAGYVFLLELLVGVLVVTRAICC